MSAATLYPSYIALEQALIDVLETMRPKQLRLRNVDIFTSELFFVLACFMPTMRILMCMPGMARARKYNRGLRNACWLRSRAFPFSNCRKLSSDSIPGKTSIRISRGAITCSGASHPDADGTRVRHFDTTSPCRWEFTYKSSQRTISECILFITQFHREFTGVNIYRKFATCPCRLIIGKHKFLMCFS